MKGFIYETLEKVTPTRHLAITSGRKEVLIVRFEHGQLLTRRTTLSEIRFHTKIRDVEISDHISEILSEYADVTTKLHSIKPAVFKFF